jgi:hypothetical protein
LYALRHVIPVVFCTGQNDLELEVLVCLEAVGVVLDAILIKIEKVITNITNIWSKGMPHYNAV